MGEKARIDRFIETAEKIKVGEDSTVAEKLFGKDKDGQQIEAGIFTRAQVAILAGVHAGTVGVDALDVLLPGSGKPEQITGMQMTQAVAYLTPEMIEDISKVLETRKAAKETK